jgi:two-component system response regulator (stage 0 sporulation protein F)
MTDAKVKLLYVDDDEMNLYLFKEQFKVKYEVLTALSGLEGLQELEEDAEIKVVISDMTMPFMNGLDLIRRAKSQRNELLCFLLTGVDVYPEAKNAVASQLIEGYFVKPYQASEIDDIIQEALKRRKL